METLQTGPIIGLRGKTDKSLQDERQKTDVVIDRKTKSVEQEADEKTRLSRAAADQTLDSAREHTNDADIVQERLASDKAQDEARAQEDHSRVKERFQKRLIAAALLKSERQETDSNLLDERVRFDDSHGKATEALVTRDQFLAVVSHDLRNPLASIAIGAGLMRRALAKETVDIPKLIELVEVIEGSSANMDRMISDLLDVERMSRDQLDLQICECEMGALLSECADLFAPLVLSKAFSLNVKADPTPILAAIDRDRILQVLSNLLGNALKFGPSGSSVVLSAVKKGNVVEVSVADNGPGIPNDEKLAIFERFSQLKSRDRRGLGLGLFISKWVVEAHNGRIWVNSSLGQGSTFTFSLPLSLPK